MEKTGERVVDFGQEARAASEEGEKAEMNGKIMQFSYFDLMCQIML